MRRLSKNARLDTPLARAYRSAKTAYREAGRALRRSCVGKRTCGHARAFVRAGHKRYRFVVASVQAMQAEFLRAPAKDGGSNEDVIRAQLGHLNVRDPVQWEPIAEKYEKRGVATFQDAFRVLARAAARSGKPDWRRFDLATLQACPGLDDLELPTWLHEAKGQSEEDARFAEVPF